MRPNTEAQQRSKVIHVVRIMHCTRIERALHYLFCRLECTLTMQRNVRTRKFTVNVRKNRAQHRKMQLDATNPY